MRERVRLIAMRVVQALAGLVGILGVTWIYLGLRFTVGAIADRDLTGLIVVPMFLGFGGIMVAVAGQAIWRYSESAVTSIATLTGFAVFGFLSQGTRVMWADAWNGKDMTAQFVWQMLPIAVAWLSYRAVKWLLLRLTIKGEWPHEPPASSRS